MTYDYTEVRAVLDSSLDRKILLIRAVRDITGWSLKESLDHVKAFLEPIMATRPLSAENAGIEIYNTMHAWAGAYADDTDMAQVEKLVRRWRKGLDQRNREEYLEQLRPAEELQTYAKAEDGSLIPQTLQPAWDAYLESPVRQPDDEQTEEGMVPRWEHDDADVYLGQDNEYDLYVDIGFREVGVRWGNNKCCEFERSEYVDPEGEGPMAEAKRRATNRGLIP